ncbi:hypothetical protein ACFPM0_11345 [Pseudonocardia sulfidoxydans]|uniref:hypothetical protein n=1 Tax=Pseudonocardia sulfidoxydans TaxID=54011 RepID=UPI003616D41A
MGLLSVAEARAARRPTACGGCLRRESVRAGPPPVRPANGTPRYRPAPTGATGRPEPQAVVSGEARARSPGGSR